MSHKRSVIKAGEPGIRYQPHTLMQPIAYQGIGGQHHLLHAWRTLAALIADHNYITGYNLAPLNRSQRFGIIVESSSLPVRLRHDTGH